ncbi:MAG: G5 domain-containing protein, partial [Clostridiales bacterium]
MAKAGNSIKQQELKELGQATFIAATKQQLTPATYQPEQVISSELVTRETVVEKHGPPSILIACAGVLLCLSIAFSAYLGLWENGSFDFGALAAKKVTLIVNGSAALVSSKAMYIKELLEEQGIALAAGDSLSIPAEKKLEEGMTIRIVKSIEVTVIADDHTYQLLTKPVTVSAALADAGVTLKATDEVSLSLSRYLYEDTQVEVYRIKKENVTQQEEIEPTITRQESSFLESGVNETLVTGNKGLRENTYQVTYRNGAEYSRELVESKVVREPGTTIIAYGTMALSSRAAGNEEPQVATTAGGNAFTYVKKISVEATAYTATGNRTATGTWPKVGTIAVDPKYIPLGTKVYI